MKLAIIGPGLLGGSLALAMRARNPDCLEIAIWARREVAVEEVRAMGVADVASTDLAAVATGANIVVFCVPIGVMPELARQIVSVIEPDALVTDVGSVKGPVVDALVPIFQNRGRFVGSHPMAGSEQSGLAASRADLFDGAVCILTPHPEADPQAVEELGRFWRLAGCTLDTLSPQEHDRSIGLVSHLPHLLAAVLVDFVCAEDPNSINFCGNGFRDTTRVASGPPNMWTEILLSNRVALAGQLSRLVARLGDVSAQLASGNESIVREILTDARNQRELIPRKGNTNG